MGSYLLLTNGTDNDPGDCLDGIHWIWIVFGQCLISTVEIIGFYLGLFSILCWFLVYIPQLYENYKRGRCDDALSIWFLLFWLMGDSCNLIGCFLTHQFPIQTMTAIYYCTMDLVIIGQWVYYDVKNRRNNQDNSDPNITTGADSNGNMASLPALVATTTLMTTTAAASGPVFADAALAGYIIGLLSTVFYLGSRLPQIIMNFKRGKTDGLSYFTFLLAVIANFAYAFSVLMGPRAEDQAYIDFVLDHLPWLTGSLGTVVLDLTILLQCLCLKSYVPYDELTDEEEADEEQPLLQA
jgi:uncharacterized protein with PQ loop repeat